MNKYNLTDVEMKEFNKLKEENMEVLKNMEEHSKEINEIYRKEHEENKAEFICLTSDYGEVKTILRIGSIKEISVVNSFLYINSKKYEYRSPENALSAYNNILSIIKKKGVINI